MMRLDLLLKFLLQKPSNFLQTRHDYDLLLLVVVDRGGEVTGKRGSKRKGTPARSNPYPAHIGTPYFPSNCRACWTCGPQRDSGYSRIRDTGMSRLL